MNKCSMLSFFIPEYPILKVTLQIRAFKVSSQIRAFKVSLQDIIKKRK